MKRIGHLIERIADIDNLRLAFWKACKGKNGKPDVEAYRANLHDNLIVLQAQILSGKVEVGNYHYFKIYDPKERQICAAAFGERVLHHALMNGCHEYFENKQIAGSYASRKGKGQYAAIDSALGNTMAYRYYLKLDMRKYFDSINHSILKTQLSLTFKDKKLLAIFYQIIDSSAASPNKGLPIGNLTSQYFANHYLAQADHYAKDVLHLKGYVRYMDDAVLWHSDKAELLKIGKLFEAFLNDKLDLTLKIFCLNATKQGLPFLGYRISPFGLRLSPNSKARFKRKILALAHDFEKNKINETEYQRRVLPLLAFVEKAQTHALRQSILF
jgi:hypothetical protein